MPRTVRTARLMCTAALLTFALSGPGAAQDTRNADAVDYRRHVMRTLGEQVAALGLVAQGRIAPDNLTFHTRALAAASSQIVKAFEARVAGGDAKPEIWWNWPEFARLATQLKDNLAAVDKAAQEGGAAAAIPKLQDALTCKSCHDLFRSRQ